MNGKAGRRSFLTKVGLILIGGLVIFFGLTIARVVAQSTDGAPAAGGEQAARNLVGSYGSHGMEPLTVQATDETPKFIANPLKEKRGVILLVYVKGATEDEEMLASFNRIKAQYAAQASFFSFEARDISELGDVPAQLQIDQPPALAVISGDGKVYQEYTGWIGEKVMEQAVANALRN